MYLKNLLKDSFYKSPQSLKNLYSKLPHSFTFGSSFREDKKILEKANEIGLPFVQEIVNERFLETINIAFNHIPFYQNLYAEYGVSLNQIKSIDDITQLPIIKKSMLIESKQKVYNDKVSRLKFLRVNTGGSTGKPISFYLPSNRYYRAWAYKIDMWSKTGYSFGDPVLSVRGHHYKNKIIEIQPLYNFHYTDFSKVDDSTIKYIYEYLLKYKIYYLQGYPSNITRLIEYFINNNLDISFIKGVLPSSEQLLDSQISFIKKSITNISIQASYEQSEMTVLATTTPELDSYEFYPTYGYPEIVDEQGEKSNSGLLIGTSFNNLIMPFIRYETGDTVETVKSSKKSLTPKVTVSGRNAEYITFNNRKHPLTGFNHYPLFDISRQFQVYQEGDYLAIIFRASKSDFNIEKIHKTLDILKKNTDGFLNIEIIQVEKEILTIAGKFKLKINDEEFNKLEIVKKFQ